MAQFTVTHPDTGFKGDIVGIGFTAGTATVDTGTEGGLAAYSYFQRAGSGLAPVAEVEPEPEPVEFTEFDPSAHGVKDVLAYLATLDDEDEKARVLAAEADGQARKGILGDQQPASIETGGQAATDEKGAEQ